MTYLEDWLNKINWGYGMGQPSRILSNKTSLLEQVKAARTDEEILKTFKYIFHGALEEKFSSDLKKNKTGKK